jgi:hypothetical protein
VRLAPVDNQNRNFKLVCKKVKANTSFVIPSKVIHQLKNTGDSPLILIFNCPLSHLKNDRFVMEELLNEGYEINY